MSDDMIEEIVAQQLAERADLDFKKQLPAAADVKTSDFAKDVAATRNSGGGTIIYGITEANKRATDRSDVELSENPAVILGSWTTGGAADDDRLRVLQVGATRARRFLAVVASPGGQTARATPAQGQ